MFQVQNMFKRHVFSVTYIINRQSKVFGTFGILTFSPSPCFFFKTWPSLQQRQQKPTDVVRLDTQIQFQSLAIRNRSTAFAQVISSTQCNNDLNRSHVNYCISFLPGPPPPTLLWAEPFPGSFNTCCLLACSAGNWRWIMEELLLPCVPIASFLCPNFKFSGIVLSFPVLRLGASLFFWLLHLSYFVNVSVKDLYLIFWLISALNKKEAQFSSQGWKCLVRKFQDN